MPRVVVRRAAAPYIAGPTLDDALHTVKALNGRRASATVAVLGEEVTAPDEAIAIAGAYHGALAAIAHEGLHANISVKLTALGLRIDRAGCRELLEGLVRDAAARDSFVRIDMEDADSVDDTLALYRGLREDGLDAVGIVLQAYLRRTLDDIAALADLRPSVRLCKGIYVEPEDIAYGDRELVRRSFVSCLDALLEIGSAVGIATHDEVLLADALRRVEPAPESAYEFQMLLGVRERRGAELVAAGHPLRVYVPYGERWYEYSLRRLQENPRMAGMVARATAARLARGLRPRGQARPAPTRRG